MIQHAAQGSKIPSAVDQAGHASTTAYAQTTTPLTLRINKLVNNEPLAQIKHLKAISALNSARATQVMVERSRLSTTVPFVAYLEMEPAKAIQLLRH